MKSSNAIEYLKNKRSKMPPALAYPKEGDWQEWRRQAKEKLWELLGLPLEKCDDEFVIKERVETDQYQRIQFEFQSEEGYYIPCTMLRPLGITGPLPTVICLQGHSTGMHISLGEIKYEGDAATVVGRDIAVQAVKEGYCAIAMDQRYMGAAGSAPDGSPGCSAYNAALSAVMMGRTAIGERVWDVQRLIDVMETKLADYVDMSRIICTGNSGGGTVTFYAGALEERIYMSIPSCAVCTYEDSIMAMLHCCCNYIPGIRKYFEMEDVGCLTAPRKLLVVSGQKDDIFPIEGAKSTFETIKKAYHDLGCEENCHMAIGPEGHKYYPELVWGEVKKVL